LPQLAAYIGIVHATRGEPRENFNSILYGAASDGRIFCFCRNSCCHCIVPVFGPSAVAAALLTRDDSPASHVEELGEECRGEAGSESPEACDINTGCVALRWKEEEGRRGFRAFEGIYRALTRAGIWKEEVGDWIGVRRGCIRIKKERKPEEKERIELLLGILRDLYSPEQPQHPTWELSEHVYKSRRYLAQLQFQRIN